MATNNFLYNQSDYSSNHAVAFFSRREDAYRAIEALRDNKFSNAEIGVIEEGDTTSYAGPAHATAASQGHGSSFWQSVKDFFSGETHEDYSTEKEYDYDTHYSNAISDLGWNKDRAAYYRYGLRSGGALVTVTGERTAEARQILERNGGDLRESGFDVSSFRSAGLPGTEREHRVQLRGERLRTYKERVQRGAVTLRKDVVTENKTVQVPVTHEELVIERTPISGEARVSGEIGSDKEIRVPLSEEQVRVEKKPIVNEEVRVGKRQVQRTEQVSDQVRHEELRTEREGDVESEEPEGNPRFRKDPAA